MRTLYAILTPLSPAQQWHAPGRLTCIAVKEIPGLPLTPPQLQHVVSYNVLRQRGFEVERTSLSQSTSKMSGFEDLSQTSMSLAKFLAGLCGAYSRFPMFSTVASRMRTRSVPTLGSRMARILSVNRQVNLAVLVTICWQ